MSTRWWSTLIGIVTTLEQAHIDYTLLENTSLYVQGALSAPPTRLALAVQWDLFQRACELFATTPEERVDEVGHASFTREEVNITLTCQYNMVVVTDPERLRVEHNGQNLWVKALDFYVRTLPANNECVQAIKAYWHTLQEHNNHLNAQAWNQETYNAWLARFGAPEEAATRLRTNPRARLGSLVPHLPELQGRKIINLLGSHGARAIALALLGAKATVVDISSENASYALDVARAAGVDLRYIVSDVLSLPGFELDASYDLVLLELGVLHYFVDLEPLMGTITRLLRPGGLLLLQDFHPISTKLITSRGARHKVSGNYFDKSIITQTVATSKHLNPTHQEHIPIVYQRQWTLGEIVTAIASSGLIIASLTEEPNPKLDDRGIPKLFTITAHKSAK